MKHVNKIAAILALSLLTVGCNEPLINQVKLGPTKVADTDKDVDIKNLQTIYETLYNSSNAGVISAVNTAIYEIAKKEIAAKGRTAEVDTRIAEKLTKLAEGTSYVIDGEFHEELLVSALRVQGYNIVTTGEYSNDPTALKADYTDYEERKLKVDVYKEMLNEQYILDNKASLISDKKVREVEYLTITYTDATKIKVTAMVDDFVSRISNGTVTDLSVFANEWKAYRKTLIDEEVAKIETDESKAIENKYTYNNAYTLAHGIELAKKAIDDVDYVKKETLSFSTTTVFSAETTTLIKNATELKEINNIQYVPAHYDKTSIDINDTSKSQYQIIQVKDIINSESSEESKLKAVKVLANSSANVSGAILHYFEQYNLSVHDQDIYDYLKANYKWDVEE